MSRCFHPHLFHADRFHEAIASCDAEDHEAMTMLLVDCFVEEAELDAALVGEDDTFAARYHPEGGEYLGGLVDAVRAGLPPSSAAAPLLRYASCLDGRLADVEPAIGYLDPTEVVELARELAKVTLPLRGLEADRLLLLRILTIAQERRRGLAFIAS